MSKSIINLFAPKSYRTAPRHYRAAVANGCGTAGWKGTLVPDTIYGLRVTSACNIHDWMYHYGNTLADKDEADRVFLNNLLRLINGSTRCGLLRTLRRRRALKYYHAVRLAGGPAFWDSKNAADTIIPSTIAEITEEDRK